jgi:cytoskeletal protein RodZ
MDGIGHTLRDARAARGMSLEDVAVITKIPRSSLEWLENDEFKRLPAPVFVRGFIRSYAGAVGADPAPLVQRFNARQHEEGQPQRGGSPAEGSASMSRSHERRLGAGLEATERSSHGLGSLGGGYALLAFVVLGLLVAAFALVGGRSSPSETSAFAPTAPVLHERIDGIRDLGAETLIDFC